MPLGDIRESQSGELNSNPSITDRALYQLSYSGVKALRTGIEPVAFRSTGGHANRYTCGALVFRC